MITIIKGLLIEVSPLRAVIEVSGIGYEINIPVTTTERLPAVGSVTTLHTLTVYREDSAALYGFHHREDRDFFRLLVEKVSGIGPRMALSILSKLSVSILKNALASGDVAMLCQCPGIGKKTAERLVIELKDKVAPSGVTDTSIPDVSGAKQPVVIPQDNRVQDAVNALITLGYKATEADKSVRRALGKVDADASTGALIKAALS